MERRIAPYQTLINKKFEVKKELSHEVEMGFMNWASVTHNNYIAHIEK